MKKKDKRAETAESTAVVEDSKLENVTGGDIPDGHSHQDSDRAVTFFVLLRIRE